MAAALDPYTQGVLRKLGMDAQKKPFMTPALLTYLRGVGMSLGTAENTRAQQRGEVQRSKQRGERDINVGYQEGRRNLTADLVSRGILGSGESTRRYGDQDQERARKSNDLTAGTADRMSAVDRAYRQVEDTLRQTTTERMIQAEQEEANRKATLDAQKRQQDSLLKFYQGGAK